MFTGFTDETVDFMWGIRFNNERAWFEAHKEIYLTHFYQPMRELGDELYDYIAAKRPDLGLIRKVTRIYRDVRRLHGRGPYKESLWFSIEQPSEEWTAHPTFWFELMPEGWTCGMGYYMPKPLTMAKLRARIDRDPAAMEKLMRKLNRQKELVLETEDYKRPRAPAPSKLLEPWYRARSFTICHNDKLTDELFSRDIVERLRQDFTFLLPYYDYFVTLEGDPDPRDAARSDFTKGERSKMKACPERSAALALLRKYNAEPFHIQHGLTVEGVMRWYAQELGYGEDADFWAAVGLLHDVDFEKWPEAHCKKAPELLAEIGCSDEFIHAVCSHGYGLCSDVEPTEEMEKVLFAADELTGLIGAAALMRPSKSCQDMEVSSLKKKFKDKKFAAGCSRDVIKTGAERLGWTLEELMEKTLQAQRSCEESVAAQMAAL